VIIGYKVRTKSEKLCHMPSSRSNLYEVQILEAGQHFCLHVKTVILLFGGVTSQSTFNHRIDVK